MTVRAHPLHPIVAIFPMALLAASAALDAMAWAAHRPGYFAAARFALGAGAIASVVTAIPGIADTLAYPRGARRVPVRHGVLNGVALAAMAAGWWLRGGSGARPSVTACALSVIAVALTLVAWRMGVRLTASPGPSDAR